MKKVLPWLVLVFPLFGALFTDQLIVRSLLIFLAIVTFWFAELIPLAVTGLLVPVYAVLLGVLPASSAFLPFGNQVLFLFIGSFFLAKAMQKHRWDTRMAYFILSQRFVSHDPGRLIFMIGLLCYILSMWISNTASCAIMTPMCLGIVTTVKDNFKSETDYSHFKTRLLLTCAFASSIGGMATPVGSPPNMLAIQFLQNMNIRIDFFDWMLFGLPISGMMLFALYYILKRFFPVGNMDLEAASDYFVNKFKGLGKISSSETQVFMVFIMAVTLWILPGLLKNVLAGTSAGTFFAENLPMGVVALFSAILLFIMSYKDEVTGAMKRNICWEDVAHIDWGTILLFGGGLCLGKILQSSGLARAFGDVIFSVSHDQFLIIGAISVFFGILMSELSSNTASTSIIVPIILSTFSTLPEGKLILLVVATAFGASYGFMLPVSTPPNAIVFGTGEVKLRDMIRSGIFFDLSGLVLIVTFVLFIFPLIGIIF
jgi:solute carrier family 13 (sodium-dependent dicarboxylate transporter), member 2/3/5